MSGRWSALRWGAARRCPRCGSGGIFASYFTLRDHCPACGFDFEREEGYWVGALIVNIAVTEALFGLGFLAALLVTWPDVPWTGLLVLAIAVNALVPVLFYPLSKTIWLGLDLAFNPPTASEEGDAARRRDPRLDG